MGDVAATITVKLLAQIRDETPVQVGTIEVPFTADWTVSWKLAGPPRMPDAEDTPYADSVIGTKDVNNWSVDDWHKYRARLWVSADRQTYRDGGETGRMYTAPAAALLTGWLRK